VQEAFDTPQVLGVLGMPGSGKSLLAGLLIQSGVPVVRLGQFIVQEVRDRNLPHTSAGEAVVRGDLREREGDEVLAKRALQWLASHHTEPFVALDGVYSPQEDRLLRSSLGDDYFTLAVVCDRAVRYRRLAGRMHRPLERAEAEERDRHELEILRKGDPIVLSDYFCLNNADPTKYLVTALDSIAAHLEFRRGFAGVTACLRKPVPELLEDVVHGILENPQLRWPVLARTLVERNAMLTWHVADQVGRRRISAGAAFLVSVGADSDSEFEDTSLHLIAARAFGQIEGSPELLEGLLSSNEAEARRFAVDALGERGDSGSLEPLLDRLVNDPDDLVADWAGLSVAKVAAKTGDRVRAVELLQEVVRTGSVHRSYLAFDTLARIDSSSAARVLAELASAETKSRDLIQAMRERLTVV
jgi:dephospho-CoA kinase